MTIPCAGCVYHREGAQMVFSSLQFCVHQFCHGVRPPRVHLPMAVVSVGEGGRREGGKEGGREGGRWMREKSESSRKEGGGREKPRSVWSHGVDVHVYTCTSENHNSLQTAPRPRCQPVTQCTGCISANTRPHQLC